MMSFRLINPLRELPWWLRDKESACSVGAAGDTGSIPGSRRVPWRREWLRTPVFLVRESSWTEVPWWATVHRVTKRSDTTEAT